MSRLLKLKIPFMHGDDVKAVQLSLQARGYSPGKIDGVYGPKTRAAVKLFQKDKRITVDGIVGPETLAALAGTPEFTGSAHFKKEEFRCRCGGRYCNGFLPSVPTGVTLPLYDLLEKIQAEATRLYGKGMAAEFTVISGYRCPTYNKQVGGAKGSLHLSAKAADIRCNVCNTYQLGAICDRLNPKGGVGLGSLADVHVDVRGKRSRWWYTFKSWSKWAAAYQ